MNITLKNVACAMGAASLVALAGAPAALAQQDQNRQDQRQQQRDQNDRNRPGAPGAPGSPDRYIERTATFELMMNRSSELMGTAVHARNGDKIGDIADFVVSRRNGAIDSVIVNTGTILGVGGKEVRLPYHSLTWNAAQSRLDTGMTKAAIDAMPEFERDRAGDLDLDNLPDLTREDAWEERRNPDADRNNQPKMYGDSYGPNRGVLLSTIVGMDLNCVTQDCGDVEDTIVEVVTGNVVFLIIDPDENFLGIADTLRLAPFTLASWNVDASEMRIDSTKQQLLNAPEFDGEMTPISTRMRVTEIYGVYDRQSPRLDRRASENARPSERKDSSYDSDKMKKDQKRNDGSRNPS
jgi:sporulation protein YlmC with PRC-barrel domain